MDVFFLRDQDLFKFYDRISQEFDLYVPVKIEAPRAEKCGPPTLFSTEDYVLKKYSEAKKEDIVFSGYRTIEPAARAFFTYFKEDVCSYFNAEEAEKERPIAICGVKNCDIFAMKIQDYVFLEGNEEDPIYKKRRENALIISGDCPSFKEVCFCRAFEIDPHATEGFDFNLSPIAEGYLLDVGSERAKIIADSIKEILEPANLGQLSARASGRESVVKRIEEHISGYKIPKKDVLKEIVLAGYDSKVWQEQMEICVECGGCVFICDTCHCFLLADEKTDSGYKKTRMWDGCLLKNFSRVAGGANPLKMRYMRLRNRFMKKFDFFFDNLGFQACCGCGRCIEVCPGKIDIRYILKRLYDEKYLPAS